VICDQDISVSNAPDAFISVLPQLLEKRLLWKLDILSLVWALTLN